MPIDQIFAFGSTRARQRAAPLLQEREEFLAHLIQGGLSICRVRSIASMLLHIIRILDMNSLRPVAIEEIEAIPIRWMADVEHKNRNGWDKSASHCTYVTRKWLRYHNQISDANQRVEPEQTFVEQFVHYMRSVKGMAPSTISTCQRRVKVFLRWTRTNQLAFEEVRLEDVDRYLGLKIEGGYKPRSMASICSALRLFFGFTESQGWTRSQIAGGIYRPRVPRFSSECKGPDWSDVRKTLDHDFGSSHADVRGAAIISLCAIYGLRSAEVVRLRLSDLDWHNEILTIRRAKSGKIQQFPIQIEMGERVLRYLKEYRPRCACRHVFVSLRPPYRPVNSTSVWVIVAHRLQTLGIVSKHYGGHALRHSCATQLLHQGTSLQDVAQFLGHSDLRSVGVYAKHDAFALKEVAAIDLSDLL